jgi:hypothetical protein
MPECPELLAEAGCSFARFANSARLLITRLRAVAQAAEALTSMLDGYRTGYRARPRDWSMPDHWHKGYLRGRLQGMKDRHGPRQ